MKVALFTDTYDEVNGVANTFRYLVDWCEKKGKRLDVYAHTEKEDSAEERGSVNIYRYRPAAPVDIYFDMIFDIKLARLRIIRQARQRNYDLIHTATPGSMGLNALLVAKASDIPLIGSYHTSLPEYLKARVDNIVEKFRLPTDHSGDRSEDLMWKFMQWYYNQVKLILAPSEHTKALLQTKLDTEIGIFSRGIDTERFHPRYRKDHDGVVVLYVGRVSTEKNLDVLANIFQDKHDAKLMVVGDGPYRQEMQQKCPNAIFTGFLKGEELSRAYASADIFVFPSTTDTFGNVVREAMSSGLPVVVTDKMGPKEQVTPGQTGFVTCDPADFADKLNLLIRDESLRKKMGQYARQYALSQNWHAVFEKLFTDYQKAVQKG
jgi:glycosyltransferase involved in cell wall biosynthesis